MPRLSAVGISGLQAGEDVNVFSNLPRKRPDHGAPGGNVGRKRMRQKHCTPISARVERRILASLASKEAEPPRLARDILAAEAVERFVSPDTRGPQDEAEFAPPVGHIVDPATIAAAKALVGAAIFIAGVAVGKIL